MAAEDNIKAVKAYVKANFCGRQLIFSHGVNHILYEPKKDDLGEELIVLSHAKEYRGRVYVVSSSCFKRYELNASSLSTVLEENVRASLLTDAKGITIFSTRFPIDTELAALECTAALDKVLYSSIPNDSERDSDGGRSEVAMM